MNMLLLRADALLDGPRSVDAPRVLVSNGVVEAVASRVDPPHDPSATVVDLPGTTLLPGLVDAHVHATLRGGMSPPADADLSAVARDNLRIAARAGVTTVRDCGAPGDSMLGLRGSPGAGLPRCLVAGPALTPPGGHAHALGQEVAGASGLREAIGELADAGVDWVKVIGSGGGTPGTDPLAPTYTADELRVAVEAAHAAGLPLTVHALNADTARMAAAAGADSLEHGWLYRPGATERVHGALLEKIAEAGIAVCPTISAVAHRLPALRRHVRESPEDRGARADLDAAQRLTELACTSVADYRAAGVPIVAGTDAGWREVRFDGLVDELVLLRHCGLSVDETLAAATSRAVDVLGVCDRTGRVAPGLSADLVAVDGDPHTDVDVLRKVRLTVVRGYVVDR